MSLERLSLLSSPIHYGCISLISPVGLLQQKSKPRGRRRGRKNSDIDYLAVVTRISEETGLSGDALFEYVRNHVNEIMTRAQNGFPRITNHDHSQRIKDEMIGKVDGVSKHVDVLEHKPTPVSPKALCRHIQCLAWQ